MRNLTKLFICAIALIAAFACSGSSSTPSEAVMSMCKAVQAGNYDGAMDYIYLGEDKSTMSKEEMAEYRALLLAELEKSAESDLKRKGEITSVDFVEETINEDGQSAVVKVKITYSKGREEFTKITVVNSNGKWLAKP